MLGLPDRIRACLFDLDGVLTRTADVHALAWKEMFDTYLQRRAERTGGQFVPFGLAEDYASYVDGKPRAEGANSFLVSRGIKLPLGGPADPPSAETVNGLGNAKNEILLRRLAEGGVRPFPGSLRYLRAAKEAGLARAVVSSSANCRAVLAAAALEDMVDVVVDGVVAASSQLRGKPAPDTYLAAASELGMRPGQCAVFEDALAGVAAGRSGGFGWVVGVDRIGQAEALLAEGADVAVSDLAELLDAP